MVKLFRVLFVAWTRHIFMSWNNMCTVAWHMVATCFVNSWVKAHIVTAVKTAETMVGAVRVRNTRAPALVLDVGTFTPFFQCKVWANSKLRFFVV